MKILEVYRYRTDFTKALRERGHSVYLVDFDQKSNPDFLGTANEFYNYLLNDVDGWKQYKFDVIFARPHCITYSARARWYHHRAGPTAEPLTEKARWNDDEVQAILNIINFVKPDYWLMENPHADLRKRPFMAGIPYNTITYCQYGYDLRKITDIFGVYPTGWVKPPCKVGASCHTHGSGKNGKTKAWNTTIDARKNTAEFPYEVSVAIADALEAALE